MYIFSEKKPCTRVKIVIKCNERFFEKIQEKPPVAERQFLQTVTFYPNGTTFFSFVLVFRLKKEQKVTFWIKLGKNPVPQ